VSHAHDSALAEAGELPDRRRVVGVLGVTQILAWGSSFYLPAVLAKPIAVDTGWPLSLVVGGLSLGLILSAFVSPRVGRLIGRHGGRPVMAAGSCLIGVGLIVLSAAPSLPVFLLGWLVVGAGMGAGLYDAAFATLGRIYGRSARPTIVALTLFGGFASTVCWPLSAYLLAHFGWRGTCVGYAAIQLLVSLPLHLLLLPRVPPVASEANAERARGGRALLRFDQRLEFVLLSAIVTMAGANAAIVGVHVIAILQTRGLDIATAVALGALIGPSQVVARVGEMTIGRRFHPIWTLLAATLLVFGGLTLLLLDVPLVGFTLILYGAGNGIYSIARGTVPLVLFGEANYAPLMGRLAFPSFTAQAIAPPAAAYLLQDAGAHVVLAAMAGLAAINLCVTLALLLKCRARPGAAT